MSELELMLRRIARENGNFVSQEKANEVLAELLNLQHQLEIQTKRVENLKKSNEFYAYDENYDESEESLFNKVMSDSEIKNYSYGMGQFKVAGKLARSCQAIDQELEKELENLK